MIRPILRPSCLGMLALACFLSGTSTPAAEPPVPDATYRPPLFGRPEIGLLEALELTLEHAPAIRLEAESSRASKGLAQQAAGQFDLALLGDVSYSFDQSELSSAAKQEMAKKRADIAEDIGKAEERAAQYDAQLQEWNRARGLVGGGNFSGISFTDPVDQSYYDLWLAAYNSATPQQQAQMVQDLLAWIETNRGDLQVERDAELQGAEADRESLRKLGAVPEVEQNYEGTLSLQLLKPFRSGVIVTPFLDLTGSGRSYRHKEKSDELGGPGGVDSYTSSVGFTVDIPLGRGRGEASTGAAEAAAGIDYDASVSALKHQASDSLYQTLLAYWALVAEQESVKVYERTLGLQATLVELSTALVEADELPRVEMARVQAREAEVRGQLDDAYRRLHEARMALSEAIGLEVNETAEAPLAADPFPLAPSEDDLAALPVATLAGESAERRYDVRAARQLQESGRVLWRAAYIDLKPRVDLQLEFSYAGLGEDASVREGIQGALGGNWTGPAGRVGVTFERPIENNIQRGLLEQRGALVTQRAISAIDLERSIKTNVVLAAGTLTQAARQLRRYAAAAEFYRQSYESELEKLRAGTATVIDTVTTEQRWVDSQLALVGAQQQMATALAQLRFESATLLADTPEGARITRDAATTLPGPGE
ncbi:MAG: TolC family protein [Acidobacteriota bacterium]